ncbi:MAG: thioesterase, FlK family [Actinomycetes bacterium]
MKPLAPGARGSVTITVDDSLTVPSVSAQYPRFDDMPAVFATAYMVGLAEAAAMDALAPALDEGEGSVGIDVRFDHTAATPVGVRVTADAEVTGVEGRVVTFRILLYDEVEKIGEGTHHRAVINRAKFDARVAAKAREVATRTGQTTFTNAHLFTGAFTARSSPWESDGRASAFAVEDGRITWVGPVGDAPLEGTVVDLGGARVLPGLLDVHTHPLMMALLADATVLLPPACRSKADVLSAMAASPRLGAGPDAWVVGFGYNEDAYPDGGPLRADLDALSSTQPILLHRADGHNAVANSVALALAGLDDDSPDPAGGRLGRTDSGRLDGRLVEMSAVDLVQSRRTLPTASELADRLVALNDHFVRLGIVAVDDLLGTVVPDPLGVYRLAAERGFVPKVAVFYGWSPDGMPDVTDADLSGHVRLGGVKLFADGAYAARTAWVEEPYPGEGDDHGLATATDEDLRAGVAWARAHGVQCRIHVMGDRGLAHLLDLFGDEEPWLRDRPSVVLEHAAVVPPPLVARLKASRMGFALVTHTIFLFAEWDSYRANLPPSAFAHAYPLRSILDAGVPVALASDAPTTAWANSDNVFTSAYAAVTRRAHDGSDLNHAQAVHLAEALTLFTGHAADITTNRGVGRLAPGYDATFVVLDRDCFAVPDAELADVRVAATWVRGRRVYQR